MTTRLMLGCGTVGQTMAGRIAAGDGEFHLLADDAGRIDTLRGVIDGVTEGDPTDRELIQRTLADADVVFVGGDDSKRNAAIAEAARSVYPDAHVVAYGGETPNEAVLEELRAHADRVVDPDAEIAAQVVGYVTGDGARRAYQLRRALRKVNGRVAVVAHDNPDPDAIGSALALTRLAEGIGVDAQACHYGEIAHQENKAMVNLLDIDLRRLDPDDPDELGEFSGFALVDHSRPGVNDQLPEEIAIDVVVDHHPPRGPVNGRFVDIRSQAGSTCALLTEYFAQFGVEIEETVATALLYGIRIDTDDFDREVSELDFAAASRLIESADVALLERVESPNVSGETLETVARAIRNRRLNGPILTTYVGDVSDRDSLAQAADQLLDMQDVTTTVVFGATEETVYVSARSRGTGLDLGETLRLAFDQIGSAGGHSDMAGAQIPIGMLGATDEEMDESPHAVIETVLRDRFFEALRDRPFDLPDEYVSEVSEFEFPLLATGPSTESESDEG